MDIENQEAPQAEPIDRRAMLEEQLEAAERGEPIEARSRDEGGRFAKPSKVEAEPEVEEEEPPVWRRPPASWKKDFHEVWQKADPKMQEYAWQREEQMRAGVEPLLSKAQFADAMQEAISPYMNTIQGLGLQPEKAVAALMEADHKLRNSDPQTKMQYFAQLAQSYGINLGAMQGQAPTAAPNSVDPMVYQLQNELNKVRGEVMGWKQQQEMQQNQQLLGEINQFSLKADHFEEVRPTMIQLLQSGVAGTLEDAYEKAIRLNDDIFSQTQQRSQAEAAAQKSSSANRAAKAAKAAAVSVKSSTPGSKTTTKAQDRRSMLLEQFDSVNERF